MLKASAVLLDIWDPARRRALIARERVTFTMASTPFLTDLTRTVDGERRRRADASTFLCAGAPIPGPLVEQARAGLGAEDRLGLGHDRERRRHRSRSTTTTGWPSRPTAARCPASRCGSSTATARKLPPGESASCGVRSCSNFVGYLKRPQWNNTDADGWFDTGDLARMDANGYIRISGRTKDVIIRGGENIPVVEIEIAALSASRRGAGRDRRLSGRAARRARLRRDRYESREDHATSRG